MVLLKEVKCTHPTSSVWHILPLYLCHFLLPAFLFSFYLPLSISCPPPLFLLPLSLNPFPPPFHISLFFMARPVLFSMGIEVCLWVENPLSVSRCDWMRRILWVLGFLWFVGKILWCYADTNGDRIFVLVLLPTSLNCLFECVTWPFFSFFFHSGNWRILVSGITIT